MLFIQLYCGHFLKLFDDEDALYEPYHDGGTRYGTSNFLRDVYDTG